MAETGKKMGDYTPLESNKKDYFFGDGEGGVVAVGKTEAGGKKTNRLVKLSDIAGDTEWSVTRNTSGNTPDIGINVGMAYDINIGGTSKLVNMYDSNVKAGYDPSAGGSSIEPPLHLGQLWFDDHSGHQENPDVYIATGTSRNSQWKLLHKGDGTTGQVLTKTATGEAWADAPKELPATTSSDAGKALHVGSDGAPVFKFAELRQMPDVVQESASDNGHIFTNNTYTKVILKYNLEQDLYSPEVKLASDELLNCIIDIYIDSTYNLDGHDLFIMFDIQRNGGSLKHIARPLTGDHFKHLEKGSYIRIYALGDSWSAQVGIPWNTPGWLPCQLVPAAEVGDKGKMLQVLDRDGNLGWGVGIPAPENSDIGKVLTVSTSESHLVATWEEASGGGGGSGGGYTRATATFTDRYTENDQYWQDLNVQNNTYTSVVWDNLDGDAAHLKVKLPSETDLPMCIIKFDLSTAAFYPSFYDIRVYNGTKQLTRIYPMQMLAGQYEMGDGFGPIASYSEDALLCKGGYMEIHILGDSYTLYSNIGMTSSPGSI